MTDPEGLSLTSPKSAPPRTVMNASLTREAYDGWRDFAAREGVSVSGLLEVLGRELDELGSGLDSIVCSAREVDASRRRRSKP